MKHDLALFVDRLRLRLGQLDPVDVAVLVEKSASYRTDMLFELGADLADLVVMHEVRRVGEDAVREACVDVCVEAVKVWAACSLLQRERETTEHGR